MGLVIDFGLLTTIAVLAWFILAERRRFERECGRLLGKIHHQYERMDNHHRYITVLQDGMRDAKALAERVRAVEDGAERGVHDVYAHMTNILRGSETAGVTFDDRDKTITVHGARQIRPSITDVDIKTPRPEQPCPKGPHE